MKKVHKAQFTLPRVEAQRFWLGVFADQQKNTVVAFRVKPTEHFFPALRHDGRKETTFAAINLTLEKNSKNVVFSMELGAFRDHFPKLKLDAILRADGTPLAIEIAAVNLVEVELVVPVDAYGRPSLPLFE
jgi:hypothetical protein